MYAEDFGTAQRYTILKLIIVGIIGMLFVRLYMLQLFSHEEYGKESEKNSIRAIIKEPVRGYVFDRNNRLIVDVGPSFTVTVTQAEFNSTNLGVLASMLDLEPQVLQERINRGVANVRSRFTPVRVKRDIDFETLSSIEEQMFTLPGVNYEVESKRIYPGPARAAHLLGYCKEITENQLIRFGEYYKQGDIVGSSGLESSYERLLRGEKGTDFVSVNAKGQVMGGFDGGRNDVTPKEGFDLILSVDFDLQALAESLMTNYKGALVAVDPEDGGILAMVSKPDFDPSVFSGVTPTDQWNELNENPDKPLFNRATMTLYPPGSTFKMVLAAAALEEGIIDKSWHVTCQGGYQFNNRFFKCTHVHGTVNVVDAIQKSCNTFFYQLMLKVGLETWHDYGERFGFGKKTLIDIDEEAAGLIPTEAYYDRIYGRGGWTQGQLVNLGVGQGEIGASPLQMAQYAAALANDGVLHQPKIVRYIRNKRTNRIEEIEHNFSEVGLSPRSIDIIREGMKRCVESPDGTGTRARIPGIIVAGKTGTAENPHGEDHSWFVGFAPFENPKIAIACIVENAGFGATTAAPISGKVMKRYLENEAKRTQEPRMITPTPSSVQQPTMAHANQR